MNYNRNYVLALICVLGITSCDKEQKEAPREFNLDGNISGLDAEWLYMRYKLDADSMVIDSTQLTEGKFVFTGKVEEPTQASMYTKDNALRLSLYLENKGMSISGSADSLENVKVTGSETHDEYMNLQKSLADIHAQEREINKRFMEARKNKDEETMAALNEEYKASGLSDQKRELTEKFIKENPKSFVSLQQLNGFTYNTDYNELNEMYLALDTAIQKSGQGRQFAETLAIMEKTSIGKVAPEFSQANTDSAMVNLSDFRGQYVLVDFWAAWCGPCRAENPNVVAAYNKYKDKGFTVLGVSLDNDRDKWLKAIEDDGLPWTQVSDLKGWNNEVAKQYGIRGIPASYLLDPEGKIIAKNLRGEALHQKLEEVLKTEPDNI